MSKWNSLITYFKRSKIPNVINYVAETNQQVFIDANYYRDFALDILNLFLEMFSESKINESFFRIRETPRKDANTMKHLYK